MRKEIFVAGVGWMLSGVVSIATWALAFTKVLCNCASIPSGAGPSQAYIVCNCINPVGLVFIGIFVMAIGAGLLVNNKKVEAAMMKYRLMHKTKAAR